MGESWDDVEETLRAAAAADLCAAGEVSPALAAFSGDRLCFFALLRPFAKGAYADPIIELIALSVPLGADRLAFSISGRAWSLEDPIPAVSAEGDLRQRVLVIESADGTLDPPRRGSVLHPFTFEGDAVRWQERVDPGVSDSWIGNALEIGVRGETRAVVPGDEYALASQASRVVQLGHDLYCPPAVAARLGLEVDAGCDQPRPSEPR